MHIFKIYKTLVSCLTVLADFIASHEMHVLNASIRKFNQPRHRCSSNAFNNVGTAPRAWTLDLLGRIGGLVGVISQQISQVKLVAFFYGKKTTEIGDYP